MSEVLDALYESSAFKSQPGRALLGRLHVPFDSLTGDADCEARAQAALGGRRRLVVSGGMGSGKSSLIEWLVDLAGGGTLRPEVEGYFPVRVPLRVDTPEVATRAGAFAAHLSATVRRASALQLGVRPDTPASWRVTPKLTVGLGALEVELAREVDQLVPPGPAPLDVHLDALRAVFGRLEASGLVPVVVFDDADAWLGTAWQPDADAGPAEFFATVPRLLAEELDVAAILAVLPAYRDQPAFAAARDFLGPVVEIPGLPLPSQLGGIILGHARACCPGVALEAVLEPDALELLHQRFLQRDHDVRHTLTVLDTALTRARDLDGALIERRDVAHALLDVPLGWAPQNG